MHNKIIVLVDMDGVLADFDRAISEIRGKPYQKEEDPPEMFVPGFFRNLPVLPGAKKGIDTLLGMPHLALYIGSKFSNTNVHSATEKLQWMYEHFPELARHCMLSCDKGLLRGDFLIDDDLKWQRPFKGQFIHFDPLNTSEENWANIVDYFKLVTSAVPAAPSGIPDSLFAKYCQAMADIEYLQRCVSAADDLRTHYRVVQESGGCSVFSARLKHYDELRGNLLMVGK